MPWEDISCIQPFCFSLSPSPAAPPTSTIGELAKRSSVGRERAGFLSEQNPAKGMKALIFNDQVAGLETFVIYLLDHDRLMETKYLFPQHYIKSNLFLDDFAKVEKDLRQKYGKPAESGDFWRDGALDRTADLGKLVAVGELTLKSRWETADTEIIHILRGENLDIDHEINYISKRFRRGAAGIMKEVRPQLSF